MRLYIERYSENSSNLDGKTLFCNRLGKELVSRGVEVTGGLYDIVDISLNVVRIKHIRSQVKLLRLDGVHFDIRTDYKKKNTELKGSLQMADGVVYQSEFSKSMCDRYLGEYNGPHVVILNGAPIVENESTAYSKAKYKYKFVACSRWRVFKRLKDIIAAFLLANIEDSVLYIAGGIEGSGVDVSRYSNNPNIKFLGIINQRVLTSYLKKATAFIHLSWFDSCPNSVIEAAAAGVPIICGNVGGTKEIVQRVGGIVCKIETPYNFEPADVYNPPAIKIRKVALAMCKCVANRPKVNSDHIDIKNVAHRYLDFMNSFTIKKTANRRKLRQRRKAAPDDTASLLRFLKKDSTVTNIDTGPLISIVTTLYNYKDYIKELIDSVLIQTYTNWELLIVDDCSTDNPYPMIKPYLADERIRYIKLRKNKGYSVAKNEGIIKAQGEFIVMIDADDTLTVKSLEERYNCFLQNPKALWCHGEVIVKTIQNKLTKQSLLAKKKLRQDLISQGCNLKKTYAVRLVHAQSVMVRKELHRVVGLYDESLRCSADTEMWDRVIRLGHIPCHTDRFVAVYRLHTRQMHNSDYKKENIGYIKPHRIHSTHKRIKEGINKDNTRLLEG